MEQVYKLWKSKVPSSFEYLRLYIQHIPLKKNCDYRNSWNLIKTVIILIISKSGQDKNYNEYEAGKNAS